ncbi:hypothetical protein CH256_20040 [Rhodococcus sp. 05-2254-6]|uniref:hypothetical protein n=1 Tax=Rhodococcus sp. 05-2254-6 TaxID=2022489 RepID=UPI000B9A4B63|nr:hypothetical protein [Rhodococcus sp. 05-2254-6]OZE24616.1 hypothetical protein CH256_20040 [Rhodococcus sp. 05-2254-6]
MTAWIEVLTAMTSESNIPLRGTIEEVHEAGSPESFRHGFAYSGTPPVLIRPEDNCRVWRSGRRTRVERIDGSPIFISDGTRAWDFTGPADRPRVGPLGRVIYLGPSQFLLQQRSTAEWAGNEFAQPTGPVETVEFAGRKCWTVRLAPPEDKPYPLRIWVDVESGFILGDRIDEVGIGSQFVELAVGEPIDEALFAWDGPAYTTEEYQKLLEDESRALRHEHVQWFTDQVASTPLTVRAPLDFTPEDVRIADNGGFDTSSRRTFLGRRPRSDEGWAPMWRVTHYVWSTQDWDWAAGAFDTELDDAAILELQQSLHPGDPVDRGRRVAVRRDYLRGTD